jgi:hypothetical protein
MKLNSIRAVVTLQSIFPEKNKPPFSRNEVLQWKSRGGRDGFVWSSRNDCTPTLNSTGAMTRPIVIQRVEHTVTAGTRSHL